MRPEIINFHHIGARAGSSAPVLRMLGEEQAIWLYDADPDCTDQINEVMKSSLVPTHIVPAFIGGESDVVNFHLNYDLYTSSQFPYNTDLKGSYDATCDEHGDYIFSESLSTIRIVKLKSETLDNIARSKGIFVDYLLMDVQGGELNILKGANDVLHHECLAIAAEINFVEFYEGQPRAEEILGFCRQRGFRFMQLEPHRRGASWFRGPLGWRGNLATFAADALFYKDPRAVKASHANAHISLKKLAMISLVGGYLEYCLECLELIDEDGNWNRESDLESEFKYVRIISGLYNIFKTDVGIFPPKFSEIYSVEEANARFEVGYSGLSESSVDRIRKRYFSATSLSEFKVNFPKLCSPANTRLEQYLIDCELSRTAKIFRERRLDHTLAVARLLGLTRRDGDSERIDLTIMEQLG